MRYFNGKEAQVRLRPFGMDKGYRGKEAEREEMKKRIIKRVGHEFDINEDGRRYGVGPGYVVELDENGKVIDLIDFVSPSSLKGLGLPEIYDKYKDLKDGDSIEEAIEENEKSVVDVTHPVNL